MDGVHNLCLPVSPLGVVARELLACEGVEVVDGVGSPLLVVVAEDAGGQLPIGVVLLLLLVVVVTLPMSMAMVFVIFGFRKNTR